MVEAGSLEVPLGEGEEETLARLLVERLIDGRASLAAMGEAARRYVAEHHDPARAAEAMLAAGRMHPGDTQRT